MATGEATRILFDLGGRVAVVTGGNRGLGRASLSPSPDAALRLRSWRATRRKIAKPWPNSKRRASRDGAQGRSDASAPTSSPRWTQIERTLGPVDILVNNAAFAILKGVLDQTAEEWDQVIATNLNACFMLAKYCRRVDGRAQKRRQDNQCQQYRREFRLADFSFLCGRQRRPAAAHSMSRDRACAAQYPGQFVASRWFSTDMTEWIRNWPEWTRPSQGNESSGRREDASANPRNWPARSCFWRRTPPITCRSASECVSGVSLR